MPNRENKENKTSKTNEEPQITDWKDFLEKSKSDFDERMRRRVPSTVGLDDFERIKTLGRGSFGRVLLMRFKKTNVFYSIKVLDKVKIVKSGQVQHTLNEKRILQAIRVPFALHLEYFFQDNSYLYFVLPFEAGGELFVQMKKFAKLEENHAKFYAAQVLLALEYLHYHDIVHRDIKPENILLGANGYLKMADFGFSKVVKGRAYTLCGTPEYIAPEIILNRGYGKSVDYWAFGVLMYEMASGYCPFHSNEANKIYEKVIQGKFRFPPYFSDDIREVIKGLLQVDVTRRLGIVKDGIDNIKDQKFFRNVPWLNIINLTFEPPYIPSLSKAGGDTSHFANIEEESFRIASTDHFQKHFREF